LCGSFHIRCLRRHRCRRIAPPSSGEEKNHLGRGMKGCILEQLRRALGCKSGWIKKSRNRRLSLRSLLTRRAHSCKHIVRGGSRVLPHFPDSRTFPTMIVGVLECWWTLRLHQTPFSHSCRTAGKCSLCNRSAGEIA